MVGSVCAAAPAVSAQQRPVTVLVKSVWLRGTVFDTLGSPVSGATVSLRLTATTPVLTDSEGHYALLAPRQMTVALQVTRSGFPTLVTRLVLPTADSLTADLYLKGAVVSLPMAAGSTAPDSAARLVV